MRVAVDGQRGGRSAFRVERHRQDDDVARESRIVGTAAYLAPEYLERLVVSPQMDVYALGVLAYELCTGVPPFGGTLHVLQRLSNKLAVPRVSELNPDIPPELDDIIDASGAIDLLNFAKSDGSSKR